MTMTGTQRVYRSRASAKARAASPAGGHPLAGLLAGRAEAVRRLRAGTLGAVEAARLQLADSWEITDAIARRLDDVAADDLVQLGSLSRALIASAAHENRAVRDYLEADGGQVEEGATHTIRIERVDAAAVAASRVVDNPD